MNLLNIFRLKDKLTFIFISISIFMLLSSCNKQITQNRVFVNKQAQQRFTKAEQFVEQHFKNYEVAEEVLFEFHVIYFNNNDEFTISKLGAYQSVAELAADKQLLFQITENQKESYTGYIMLRNYDLYKEIEILDETDVLFYFPDAVKMQTDYKTKAFYELDNYIQTYLNEYNAADTDLILWAIPVAESKLQFDKKVQMGSGVSTREILLNAFENKIPILEDAIYVELAPKQVLQQYRIVDLYNELQIVKNYLKANKANADAVTLLNSLKKKQTQLSDEFSELNKQLINVNENETILRQMLIQILNKIEN